MSDNLNVDIRGGVLASDLDGTLIPLDDEPQNQTDLQVLARRIQQSRVTLVFVTGRHFESVAGAIQEYQLPPPDWIICDVGTTIFQRQTTEQFVPVEAYPPALSRDSD